MQTIAELKWRGLVYDISEGAEELLATQKVTAYNGFDATADSLHVGHLVPLIALARLQRFGHSPIALAGGGTSMIGDPSGKTTERQLLSREQIEANIVGVKCQLAQFLDFEVQSNPARLINNADWLLNLPLVDFLRDIGKHFTVNYMITKDSVKSRLEREDGISFTEFSYMLLQSYDFLHLHDTTGCLLQTGGSDQWGNITAGVELVRRTRGHSVYGMVYPLITKSDGTKFGKTETGTVWLSAERTSPYRFYQFWMNALDKDVVHYLKVFTFFDQEQVNSLAEAVAQRPEGREAQRALAREMTRMMHGETALARAEQASAVLFGAEISGLTAADIQEIFADVPSNTLPADRLAGSGLPIIEILVLSGLVKSKGEARRLIDEGGASLNNRRCSDAAQLIGPADVLDGGYLVLRKGRKNYSLLQVVN
jgi:tyrosyl-tRNA synthetase